MADAKDLEFCTLDYYKKYSLWQYVVLRRDMKHLWRTILLHRRVIKHMDALSVHWKHNFLKDEMDIEVFEQIYIAKPSHCIWLWKN